MGRLAPLVMRLFVVSLVALALAEPKAGDAGTSNDTVGADVAATYGSTVTPVRINTARPAPITGPPRRSDRKRNRKRTTTTTTTTTTEPYDDDDEYSTTIPTTTVDPRTYDHTDLGTCEIPLGMENGLILNESLSSSSNYDQSVSPLSSRIRTEIRGGAWCPNGLISPKSRQFLEIDLRGEYIITGTETQGRFANAVGVEFVENYALEYWRDVLGHWVMYKDFSGSKHIPGNTNTYTPRKSSLEASFIASKVRFFPYAAHPRTACMRVELYGCKWKQDIVAYSAPKGCEMSAMTGGARFEDLTYDGYMTPDGVLCGGLGQLTDSYLGPSDFELADNLDTSGSRWVGWNRTTFPDVVNVTLNFSDYRLLRHVDIHTNNMFTKDVQLFKEVEVCFSLEGERWQGDCIGYEPKQDRVSEHARTVHVELENRTAKHVMLKLHFQHEWILISEISFKSTSTTINASDAFYEDYYQNTPPSSRKKRNSATKISIGLTCGALVGLGAIVGGISAFLFTRRSRMRLPNVLQKPFCPSLRNTSNARNNRRAPRLALALANCPPIHMLRPAIVDEDYREPYNIWRETLGRRDKRQESQEQNEYNEICEDPEFPRPYMMKRPDPHENFYAATDIIHHTYPEERHYRRERPAPGLFTSIKLPEAEPPNGVAPLLDFPRGRMKPISFLGEAPHGNIQMCETDGIEELSDEESPSGGRRRLVVVKSLWRGCHNDIKAAFAREATWGAGLKHPQLARVLGISLLEPPCAALDRGEAVALPTLLRRDQKLNYSNLIHICCQIAAGMKYLESFELIHRDLAARNVTVSEELNVKISDYAMFCEEYVTDYHILHDGMRIPLRWMAWEGLLMGMFSPASDVWSFGVTVWEILTYCSARPYDDMNDDQVIANAGEWSMGGRLACVPCAPPPRCRRELYDLMYECWRREPAQRPRFYDLHRFLDRMSHGHGHGPKHHSQPEPKQGHKPRK